MPRPFPVNPRGPRRAPRKHAETLLAVPRVCPEWELTALRALMKPKPHERGALEHRAPRQPWPTDASERVAAARELARARLEFEPELHLPPEGDYFLVTRVPKEELQRAMAFAVVLSRTLSGLWLVLGRLYLKDGGFYRRERGFKLNLVPAANVHLRRELRAAISGSGTGSIRRASDARGGRRRRPGA